MPSGKAWIEKRRFERVEVALKVTYVVVDPAQGNSLKEDVEYKDTRLEAVANEPLNSPIMFAVARDISEGGLALVSSQVLPIGSYLVLDIALPSMGQTLRALAMVMRRQDGPASDSTSATYRMGLQMIALHKHGLRHLQDLIAQRAYP